MKRHVQDMRTKTTTDRAAEEVVSWRRRQLGGVGFPPALAAALATDARYDLHALIELVERGCPPELAVRILAPVDGATA